jgi:DNA-binding NarL/FixJ family response regulator
MMPLFVDSHTAYLFTSILLISGRHNGRAWRDWLSACSPYYCILRAETAEDGIELLRSKTFDCVVLDLDMPDADLTGVLAKIPDRPFAPLAVVALTGTRNISDSALFHGAHASMTNHGLTPRRLHAAVKDAILSARKAA